MRELLVTWVWTVLNDFISSGPPAAEISSSERPEGSGSFCCFHHPQRLHTELQCSNRLDGGRAEGGQQLLLSVSSCTALPQEV